jgi:hypothetical protein
LLGGLPAGGTLLVARLFTSVVINRLNTSVSTLGFRITRVCTSATVRALTHRKPVITASKNFLAGRITADELSYVHINAPETNNRYIIQ